MQLIYFPVKALRSKAITAVKTAEPITAQTTGKDWPCMEISKIGGSPNLAAIHVPI